MTLIEKTAVCGKVTKCFHHCAYCMMGSPSSLVISWDKFTAAVEKFGGAFELNNNYDLSPEQYKWYFDMSSKTVKQPDSLLMGGMRMRTEDEMFLWLKERREIGLKKVIFSMGGTEEFHDRMNGRKGDFRYLLDAQRASLRLGLKVMQRVFVTKSNLQSMTELCETLDALGEPVVRSIYPLHYKGNAKAMEDLRLDTDDLKSIPEDVMKYMMPEQLKSEREWAEILSSCDEPYAERLDVHYRLTPVNIDGFLLGDCHEIVRRAEEEAKKTFDGLPDIKTLCRMYAHRDSQKLYEGKRKMTLVWLERYIADRADAPTSEILRSGFIHG